MIGYVEYDRLFSGVKNIGINDAVRWQNDDDALFVDVRDTKAYQQGHILDAKHIPLDQITKRLSESKSDKKLVLVCEQGIQSRSAGKKLRKAAGLNYVYTLQGGMEAWRKANMPTVTR